MNVFKWTKDNKLYYIWHGEKKTIALPFDHKSQPILNPELKEFVPVSFKKN